MRIEIYQWLVPLISLYFLYRSYNQFRFKKRTGLSFSIWAIFWLVLLILSLIPDSLASGLAVFLGFKDNVHAIIFTALGLLFLISFYYSGMIEGLEKKMTDIVREDAILKKKLEDFVKSDPENFEEGDASKKYEDTFRT